MPPFNRPVLEAAWRRLGAASNWASVAAQQAMLSDGAYQALLAEQPLFAGAAMLYGPRRHPLLDAGDGLQNVRAPDRGRHAVWYVLLSRPDCRCCDDIDGGLLRSLCHR